MNRSVSLARLIVGCLLLLLFPVTIAAQQLEIHYINVSWGGSVLVKGPNGTTVLLEAGNTGRGTSRVVPYLQSIGILPAWRIRSKPCCPLLRCFCSSRNMNTID